MRACSFGEVAVRGVGKESGVVGGREGNSEGEAMLGWLSVEETEGRGLRKVKAEKELAEGSGILVAWETRMLSWRGACRGEGIRIWLDAWGDHNDAF